MGGESRRERRALARINRKAEKPIGQSLSTHSTATIYSGRFAGIFVVGLALGLSIAFWLPAKKPNVEPLIVAKEPNEAPLTLGQLTELPETELAHVDLALINLLCSEGLPGHDGKSNDVHLLKLEQMVESVRSQTLSNFHRFFSNPVEFENSEEFYKILVMNTVLGQDFGLQYNPNKIAAPSLESLQDQSFYDKADDVFLSGLLGEHRMGTCSSMPVLLVAVGRRLGYPLKLVGAKGHLFFRWDDGKVVRNFECTNGIVSHPDSYYMKFPYPITDEEVKEGWYLRDLSPRQELAMFFALRGHVLGFHRRTVEALLANVQANLLHPEDPNYKVGLMIASQRQCAEMGLGGVKDEPLAHRQENNDPWAEVRGVQEMNFWNVQKLHSGLPPPGVSYPPAVGFPSSSGFQPGTGFSTSSRYPSHSAFPPSAKFFSKRTPSFKQFPR
jgi:hypothetical protein